MSNRRKEFLPIGKNPRFNVYHELYDKLRVESDIINSGSKKPDAYTTLWDKANIIGHLASFNGDDKGYYERSGQRLLAIIPALERQLKILNKEFKSFKQTKVNTGYEEPTEMPTEIHEKQMELYAKLDVRLEERDFLQKRLDTWVEEEEQNDKTVLYHGLLQWAKLHGKGSPIDKIGLLKTIDGQKVDMFEKVLIIKDKRSPYNGMSIVDYRRLADEWKEERRAHSQQQLLRMQEQARIAGTEMPTLAPRPALAVSKSSLPKWPSWAKNHLTEEKES